MTNRMHSFTQLLVRFAVCGVLVLAASQCQAKNNCPWLTEATVSGLLGADAVGEYTEGVPGQASVCAFTSNDNGATRTLTLNVLVTQDFDAAYKSAAKTCGDDATPLVAIGNLAIACAQDGRKGNPGEAIVGRVRNQVFTIAISSTQKNDQLFTRNELKSRSYTAAEQVAGNLF